MQALKGGETPPWRLDPCTVDHEVFTFGLARERLWKELKQKKIIKKCYKYTQNKKSNNNNKERSITKCTNSL